MRWRVPIGCLWFLACCGPALAGGGLAQGAPNAPTIGMPPSPPIGPVSLEPDTDRPGQDYQEFPLSEADVELCRTACESDARCTAYTYVHPDSGEPAALCRLKASIFPPISDACCISGVR